jgi:hypothetical protein
MKNKAYATLLMVSLLINTECKDKLLDLDNPNAITDASFYKTEADAIRASNAMYSSLQKVELYSTNLAYTYDLRADDYKPTKNLVGYGAFPQIANFTLNATNDFVKGHWQYLYEGVFRCNVVLEKIPAITMAETRKKWILGEAKFLRGFYYWHLANLFGNVPLILSTPKSQADFRPAASTQAQVYQQVITDFTDAKNALPTPNEWGSKEIGRATKGAAQGFLGKLYLQLGNYNEAKTELGDLINTSDKTIYDLVTDYYSNFTEANENNKESVFEIQYKPTAGDVWGGQSGDGSGVSEGSLYSLMYGNPQGGSFYNAQPSQVLIDAFEPGDPRKDATAYYPGGVVFDPAGKNEKWEENNPAGTYGNRKYFNNTPDPNLYNSGINIRVMRYADVLLMYAEALNETDGPVAALPYINRVRNRVNMPLYPTDQYPATSKEDVFQIIMHERLVEFGGEQQRWNDLVRWDNNGKIDMTPYIKTPGDPDIQRPSFNKAIHKLFPIPQSELDTNPNLSQNFGY